MEVRMPQAFLRVLYTVNGNPQYILAKSSSQVPVNVCGETTDHSITNEHTYARAPLKACLTVVCDSSPELFQDSVRDFSIYVLDPLEAQPPPTALAFAPHNTSSHHGVAVALGLMSCVLQSNDSTNILVTGTIVPNAQPALEVIFALRETKRMPKSSLHSYPSLGQTSVSAISQPPGSFSPSQIAGMTWSLPHLERGNQEHRTLTRSADFPELYIGPPRRAPGRPGGSTTSKSKLNLQKNTSLAGVSSSEAVEFEFKSKEETGRKTKQRTKPKPPPSPLTHSPFTSGPLTRHTATVGPGPGTPGFYQQYQPFYQNQAQINPQPCLPYFGPTYNPLLGILSGTPSASSSNTAASTTLEHQAALISALQGLFAANPHLLRLAASNVEISSTDRKETVENDLMEEENRTADERDDTDSDIVILDSSAVETTAFRKSSHRRFTECDLDSSTPVKAQESPVTSSRDTDTSPLNASTLPSEQSTLSSSQTSTPTASSGPCEEGNLTLPHVPDTPRTPTLSKMRKRKLDEYIQGGMYSSPPNFSPSPSPSVARESGRTLTTRRGQSSPTGRIKSVSSPPMRLPSMLDTMCGTAISSCSPLFDSSSSIHGHPSKNGDRSTALASGPLKSRIKHPGNADTSDTTLKRRRTPNLNEFMEEREARKNAKLRRPPSERKSEADNSANTSQVAPSRSAKMASTLVHAQSSPCRSGSTPSPAAFNPPMVTLASIATSESTSTATPVENPFKNFVVPAWARTSTAMLPRLSEEALARQRTEQEAKKAQVSLRRREAARAKRRRFRATEGPSKESSDEDDDDVRVDDPKSRALHLSTARGAPSMISPPLSLPVFASGAIEPIPSSPPYSNRQPADYPAPSTPPRKSISAPRCTPNGSDSCSLFTPSNQDQEPLFTPCTPSISRPLVRTALTPHSPTALHPFGAQRLSQKSGPQTPRRNSVSHQTPKSSRSGRGVPFTSPSLAMRAPQTHTGLGTRAFLLPPPSPRNLRTPHVQSQIRSKAPGSISSPVPGDPGNMAQDKPAKQRHVERNECPKEQAILTLEKDRSTLPVPYGPHTTVDDGRETNKPSKVTSNDDTPHMREEYAPSPLPPSSPLPISPFSSPTMHCASEFNETLVTNNLIAPGSDNLLSSANDSDGLTRVVDVGWLSDDACSALWPTDSEASTWLTETEAWLTDTENGGLLPADSDGAWLSDLDPVFGDTSSLAPSSASNWFSDDGDVDFDGESRGMLVEGSRGGTFDAAAFERVLAAFADRGGQCSVADHGGNENDEGEDQDGGGSTAHGSKETDAEFWESVRPSLEGKASEGVSMGMGMDVGEPADKEKAAKDIQGLLDGIVGT